MRETMKITVYGSSADDSDWEEEVEVPTRWEICSRCRGNGTHVNPNIDGNGITGEEWENEWDDDSREMYLTGGYDVRCEEGCSDGKVQVIDYEHLTPEQKKWVDMYDIQQENDARERAWERETMRAEDGYRW